MEVDTTTLTLHRGSRHCNFYTTISLRYFLQAQLHVNVDFPQKIEKWVRSDCITQLKLDTLDALMQVSLCSLPM